MKKTVMTQKQVEIFVTVAVVVSGLFGIAWIIFGEPAIRPKWEAFFDIKLSEFYTFLKFLYFMLSTLLSFIIGLIIVIFITASKWDIPKQNDRVNEQMKNLADARKAMAGAVTYIKQFEEDIKKKSSEAERLHEEILSLKLVNSESVEELDKKLSAIESLKRNRIWFERILSFMIGVFSSLIATYFYQVIQSLNN